MIDFCNDTTKDQFVSAWPGGYEEEFRAYPAGTEQQIADELSKFTNPEGTCLELGPGRGLWTRKYLSKLFKSVVCVDLIQRPEALNLENVTWIEVGNHDFACAAVAARSIDFAFSFGMFCHLSEAACRAYLCALFRVMKPGAFALLMFANWKRHPELCWISDQLRFTSDRRSDGTCWFYCDTELARAMATDNGFVDFIDVIPDFRDTLCLIRKPK